MNNIKILVSACLMGEHVRFDGEILADVPGQLKAWDEQGLVVTVCPEVAGGMPVPRPPIEVQGGDGNDVIAGNAKVADINGKDVTGDLLAGSMEALRLAKENDVVCAVLKAWSPSCGSKLTYDGTFTDTLKEGQGVAAALLESRGYRVFNEDELDEVVDLMEG